MSCKGDIRSLRRHDPDQVQRVTALAKARRYLSPLTGHPLDSAYLRAILRQGKRPQRAVENSEIAEPLWAMASAWLRGIRAGDQINRRNFDYKGHDPAYEVGGNGGEIQNSNSAAYTLGKAMSIDLDGALRNAGIERKFSGWGHDLLDPNYKRYVAPPTFPNAWTP